MRNFPATVLFGVIFQMTLCLQTARAEGVAVAGATVRDDKRASGVEVHVAASRDNGGEQGKSTSNEFGLYHVIGHGVQRGVKSLWALTIPPTFSEPVPVDLHNQGGMLEGTAPDLKVLSPKPGMSEEEGVPLVTCAFETAVVAVWSGMFKKDDATQALVGQVREVTKVAGWKGDTLTAVLRESRKRVRPPIEELGTDWLPTAEQIADRAGG